MTAPLWDVVGVGENSVDLVLRLDARPGFEPGAKMPIRSQDRAVGGQVVTTLCTCAALGLRAAYVGSFGDDENGGFARRELERRGVDLSGALTRAAANRHAVILVDPDGERVVLWSRDPMLRLEPEDLPAPVFERTRLVHVDGVDPHASLHAARLARQSGAIVTCDLDGADPDAVALFDAVTVPILAEQVPRAITGEPDVERALRVLGRRHPGPICVTLGAGGALLLDEGRVHHSPAPRVNAVDTTGAGDVFRGAFIAALLEGQPPPFTLRFATAAASVSCMRVGAVGGVPARADIDAMLSAGW
jgi:sulfofructose kinase